MTPDQILATEGKIEIELSLGQVTQLIETSPDYVQDIIKALCKIWGFQQERELQPQVCASLVLYIDDDLRAKGQRALEDPSAQ
jgi:hypothetical protein